MGERLEIVADPVAMTVTVGERVWDRPWLWRIPEYFADMKAEIVPGAPQGHKAANQFYAERLGPMFNRRLQAANYWLWIGNRMTTRTGNMLRQDGKHWKVYHEGLVWRTKNCIAYINEAERDGLFHLIPAILTFMQSPQQIRRTIGRGAWRRVASNSLARNLRIMHSMQRCRKAELETDAARFVRLLDFPSGVLPAVGRSIDEFDNEVTAARLMPRKTILAFSHTLHLVRDTRNMLGLNFNANWSLPRMQREHDYAIRLIRKRKFSDKAFAAPWTFESAGHKATLLNTPLEIAVEGDMQHHCVSAYAQAAAVGKYAVLRVEGRERATVGFDPKTGRVDQVYGACNSPVSEACAMFAMTATYAYARPASQGAA